jgi:TonB family protein
MRLSPMARRVAATLFTVMLSLSSFPLAPKKAFAQPSGVVPPELVTNATPDYPESKKRSGETASVVLTLTVDASGQPTEIVVQTSGGAAFDEAAIRAAKRLVFKPAERAGRPIAARIPFRFDFAVDAPVVRAGELSGSVRTPADAPLANAKVTITSSEGVKSERVTGVNGEFHAPDLSPGKYKVTIEAEGFVRSEIDEEVVAGEATSVIYRPRLAEVAPADPDAAVEVTVRGEKPPREVTRRVLEQREVQKIPGTNGDALRAIENMPGVARPPGFSGLLIVRGSAPQDTGIFIDGTQIPIAYHFGGLTSVVPSEMLARIDFIPGNFGPEYGRAMGGIVDIGMRSPAKDRLHGIAKVDLLDVRLSAEGPLGKTTRFLAGARRSWVDAWIGSALEAGGATSVSAAPVYYDYQAGIEQDIGSSTTARLLFLGSDDRLRIVLNAPGSDDPAIGGSLRNHTRFYRLQARTETRITKEVRWTNMLSYGVDHTEFGIGESFNLDIKTNPLTFRSDIRAKLSNALSVVAGTDTVWTDADVSVLAAPIPEDGQANGPFFARPRRLQTLVTSVFQPAGYAMIEVAPVKGVRLLPSIRADYSSDIRDWRVSPRFAARWDVIPGPRRTTMKGGLGLYQQPPQPYESLRPFGTPNLRHNQATHASAGFEQQITDQVEVSVEGFLKRLEHLVDQRPDATGSEGGLTYVNSGSGRVFGGELLLRYKPDARFFGWLAYTLSRSERRADDSEAWRIFDYDQTHILSALGSYKLGRGWEIGARFRYVTGNPYTPAVSAIYDADAGAYSPLNGTPFSGRDPAFHRLDVRIDKTWELGLVKLTAYLDLQNAYFRQNAEGRFYNYNYSRSDIVKGLPILPILGLRGEL